MSEFVENLHEVFEQFGPIRTRRMFGGHGIYHGDLMFGLVADEELYLKADADSAHWFEAEGLGQFEYNKSGKVVLMSYYQAPEKIFDDPQAARLWAERAYHAALRSGTPKRKKR